MEKFIYIDNHPEPIPCEVTPLEPSDDPMMTDKLFLIKLDIKYWDLIGEDSQIFVSSSGWLDLIHFVFKIL